MTTFEKQQAYFKKGLTKDPDFRILQLQLLRKVVLDHEEDIMDAMAVDLNRPAFESYVSGVALILQEIDNAIRSIPKWVKPIKVHTDKVHFPADSFYVHEPKGTVLVMAPWNYPVHLVLLPLVGAMAAGNTVIIRPSEQTAHVASLVETMLNNNFKEEYVHVVRGDRAVASDLMTLPFDHIFFTGSKEGGKAVLRAAAENLTPVTLELGGKSPCIVDKTANLEIAAKRIVWGKFQNAGQLCLAPDYLLVHESVKDQLIVYMTEWMQKFYGKDLEDDHYGTIISKKHVMRLANYIESANVIYGGRYDRESLLVEPTLIDHVEWTDPVMQDEIFGPVLPILTYETFQDIITLLQDKDKPLAFYLFSEDKGHQELILGSLSFGGGCINDVLSHMSNHHLPFGGVGSSGMGRYHGWFSFETFSHAKSWMKRGTKIDLHLKYPPYTKGKLNMVKKIFE